MPWWPLPDAVMAELFDMSELSEGGAFRTQLPKPAPLSDPFYYLHNVSMVLEWVRQQHSELLLPAELQRFEQFCSLSLSARALLVRLIMRTHAEFRLDTLCYAELELPVAECVAELAQQVWLEEDPPLAPEVVGRLLRVSEVRRAVQLTVPLTSWPAQSAAKALWLEALTASLGQEAKPLSLWWPEPGQVPRVIRLTADARDWFRRVRLMFFGNLRQDWSEFVITELGFQRYLQIPFSSDSRAFATRDEVDHYLLLADLSLRLEQGASLETVLADMPSPAANPWLAHRRSRLLLELGLQAARQGQIAAALQALESSDHAEAKLKALRLREKVDDSELLWSRVQAAMDQSWPEGSRQSLGRIAARVARKTGRQWKEAVAHRLPIRRLILPAQPGVSVERAAAQALEEPGAMCRYVENALFPGLLTLLCWPAVFAPLPGAFFHPFQAGPADLYRADFVERRTDLLQQSLATLESGEYRQLMLERWQRYRGVSCSLLNWAVLDEVLLQATLACIPPASLRAIFDYLLTDLRHHGRGMPDLIRLWPQDARFELVEVKGPGDRLQDHQQAWLTHCQSKGIAVSVCHVQWS